MGRQRSAQANKRDGGENRDKDRATSVELSVDEAAALHAKEWIFMQLTARDQNGLPERGVVVAHHSSRAGIQPAIMEMIASPERRKHDHYIFYGVRYFRTGDEWAAYRDAKARRGDNRDRRKR